MNFIAIIIYFFLGVTSIPTLCRCVFWENYTYALAKNDAMRCCVILGRKPVWQIFMWWIRLKTRPSGSNIHIFQDFKKKKKWTQEKIIEFSWSRTTYSRLWILNVPFAYYVCMMTFGLGPRLHTSCSADAWKVCQLEQSSVTITDFFV